MATKTEGYITELKRMNFEEVETKSTKFKAFRHSEMKSLILVGRRGNLRFGRAVSNSRAIFRPEELLNNLQRKFIEEVVK